VCEKYGAACRWPADKKAALVVARKDKKAALVVARKDKKATLVVARK